MTPTLALLLGIVLSLALVGLARRYPPVTERRVYAVGLVIAALLYVFFAMAGGANPKWLAFEALGVFLYLVVAWAGLRGRPWLLALGWAAHVAWDVLFHLSGGGAEYTPPWYPWTCVSFDLVVASAVFASTKRRPAH
ncbi:MAG TPA: DUF6010 family protein [Pyrinomonadaceae bacterium]|nr:DUF6010 family protein [Pyrinomonadaceae bacterium]